MKTSKRVIVAVIAAILLSVSMMSCGTENVDSEREQAPDRIEIIEGKYGNITLFSVDGVEYVANSSGGIIKHEPNKN